jgi:hypothetical protein
LGKLKSQLIIAGGTLGGLDAFIVMIEANVYEIESGIAFVTQLINVLNP